MDKFDFKIHLFFQPQFIPEIRQIGLLLKEYFEKSCQGVTYQHIKNQDTNKWDLLFDSILSDERIHVITIDIKVFNRFYGYMIENRLFDDGILCHVVSVEMSSLKWIGQLCAIGGNLTVWQNIYLDNTIELPEVKKLSESIYYRIIKFPQKSEYYKKSMKLYYLQKSPFKDLLADISNDVIYRQRLFNLQNMLFESLDKWKLTLLPR